jgi:hypothetical protein
MTRAASRLQWLGLLVAPWAWFGQHVVGQAVAQAACSAANATWGVSNSAWQIGLLVGAGLLILVSEAAAVAAFRATRTGDHYESPPPLGRAQLIAIAAMTTNLIYLVIILLDGIASIVDVQCRGS